MPVVPAQSVKPSLLEGRASPWRQMVRIEATGANVVAVAEAWSALHPDKLVYAEGDSWFDKFTPLPRSGNNLLEAIRTPFLTGVVDASAIGDEAARMARGWQARQTRAMFKTFDFDAILLSAGGNDLKNFFAEQFSQIARLTAQGRAGDAGEALTRVASPATYATFVAAVVSDIRQWIALRDEAGSAATKQAPVFVHGYDFFQPRNAGAQLFTGSSIGSGPWLYPVMEGANLTPAQMRAATDAVINELNDQFRRELGALGNVHVIDQRGLLTPASAASTGPEGDWLDEIHPSKAGFEKLARQRWDVALARALGWAPGPVDVIG